MDQNNRKNSPDNDETGEIISWVIVFILMVAVWPIGLLLLIRKLHGYSAPKKNAAGRTNAQNAGAARQAAWGAANSAARDVKSAARDVGAAARQAASGATQDAGNAVRKAASEFGSATRQAASQYADIARQTTSKAYFDVGRESSAFAAKAPQKKNHRSPLEKKTGKAVSTILLLIAVILFIIGASTITRAAQDIRVSGAGGWGDLYLGAFYLIGAFISFFSRNIGVRRIARYKKYYAFIAERDIVPISDIALAVGKPVKTVMRDLQTMINDGYFGPNAYIDSELDCIVLVAAAAKEMRNTMRYAANPASPPTPAADKPVNQYMAIILELSELNRAIADIAISDKIDQLEELTGKIFRIVEEDPEKLPQIRRFMNYYLPTTLKLLHSYETMEKQGVKGENITAAKQNIERILNTLVTGYEQQLDQLFQSDALDIAADINVLENLMQQDGLTGDRLEMKPVEEAKPQTMEGAML